MSLLYINPGFPSLFEDSQFNYYQNTDSKYTNCKQYFIPLDYENWHRIYSNYRMISVYFRFDMYINLTNEVWNGRKDFIQVQTLGGNLYLGIDEETNLCICCKDTVVYRKPIQMDKLTSYELHLKSNSKEELIELWIDNKLAYTNQGKAVVYFDGQSPTKIDCKNIIYIPNEDSLRHGIAFSDFIIGNTRLGDIVCDIVDTTIKTNWNKSAKTDYETNTDGSILTQDIDRTKLVDVQSNNDVIYAIEIASDIAYADKSIDELEFSVDDTYINKNQLTRNTKVGTTSDIMELHPIEKIFWDYDNIINDFNIKAGVK
jgi:hypothetical protein